MNKRRKGGLLGISVVLCIGSVYLAHRSIHGTLDGVEDIVYYSNCNQPAVEPCEEAKEARLVWEPKRSPRLRGDPIWQTLEREEVDKLQPLPPFIAPVLPAGAVIEDYVTPRGKVISRGVLPWKIIKDQDKRQTEIVISRIVHNNLFPLEGVSRARLNVQHILHNEMVPKEIRFRRTFGRSKKMPIRQSWILNRIANETEHLLMSHTLSAHGIFYFNLLLNVPFLELVPKRWRVNYALHRNGGMHEAFREAVAVGGRWVALFDSNTYISNEGWKRLGANIARAEELAYSFILVPRYQILDTANAAMEFLHPDAKLPSHGVRRLSPLIVMKHSAEAIFHLPDGRYHDTTDADLARFLVEFRPTATYCKIAAAEPLTSQNKDPFPAMDLTPWIKRDKPDVQRILTLSPAALEFEISETCGHVYSMPLHVNSELVTTMGRPATDEDVLTDAELQRKLTADARTLFSRIIDWVLEK